MDTCIYLIMKQFFNSNKIRKIHETSGAVEENRASRQKMIATDPEGCTVSETKADLCRIVLYALVKENGWRSTHSFDCLEAGSLTVCYIE